MSDLTAASANTMLDALLGTGATVYLSLHTGDPGTTGANEVVGGSYARQAITFAAASSGAKLSNAAATFTAMPAATLAGVGFWTAVSSGTFKAGAALSPSVAVAAGKNVTVASGAISATNT